MSREKGDFRDLLTILVPVFAAGVAFMVSATGMKRLQSYDEEMARSRRERREDELAIRQESLEKAKELTDDLHERQEEFKKDLSEKVDKIIDSKLEKINSSFDEIAKRATETFTTNSNSIIQEIMAMAKRLGDDFSCIKGKPYIAKTIEDNTISVGQLHKKIERLFQTGNEEDRQHAIEILSVALKSSEQMMGIPEDWFNLSAELGRNDLEKQALKVCTVALDRFSDRNDPHSAPDPDILAHAIQFATKLGQWQDCKNLYDLAERTPHDQWNWRLFVFVGDYFQARHDEASFIKLNEEFIKALPFEERPYSQLAGYWQNRGKLEKALEVIENGITKLGPRTPQLLMTKSEILLDMGKYEEVLDSTLAALEATARLQPGASQAMIMFYRASAFDALYFDKLHQKGAEISEIHNLATSAISCYQTGISTPGHPFLVEAQAKVRQKLISDACKMLNIDISASPEASSDKAPEDTKDIARQVGELFEEKANALSSEELKSLQDNVVAQLKQLTRDISVLNELASDLRNMATNKPRIASQLNEIADRLG